MESWIKDSKYEDTYYCSKEFNGCTYLIQIWIWKYSKSIKYWVGLSSGKKKKELDIFEDKSNKSTGGIKALLWVKNTILEFPEYYKKYTEGKQEYICISWADNRRRNIYERLKSEGFRFMIVDGKKCLIKKI